jgi:hypothetical protein
METPQTDGPGTPAQAEPAIKFADLTPARRRIVEDKARPVIRDTEAFKKHRAATVAARVAYQAALTHLGNEPLTTGALFLVAGAFLELASQIAEKIGDMPHGDLSEIINDPGWLKDGPPTPTERLVEAYMEGAESPYWEARSAKMEAEDDLETERTRILNATAAELFGNNGKPRL